MSQFHVRGIYGWPTMAGDDAGDPCHYYGVDLGTTRCGCVGFDLFYRHTYASFDRDAFGDDGGSIGFAGAKVTFERSIAGSNFYGYGGIGPEYFWTNCHVKDDSGVGYRFANWGRVRAGLDVHGDFTKVGREDPADDGDRRLLWTIAPVIGVEFDF